MTYVIKKTTLLLFIILLILSLCLVGTHLDTTGDNYTLKAYKNTVALYNGDKIIKTYSNIVLNTLPQKDIQSFKTGITMASQQDADDFLIDFEG